MDHTLNIPFGISSKAHGPCHSVQRILMHITLAYICGHVPMGITNPYTSNVILNAT